ncbi:MAG: flagellar hook-length control protein FliK [Formivibrio sp.]|nr:flagellar hook-length control protein FliK [Formivibrio sp.]
MTIESTRTAQGTKSTASGTHHVTAKSGSTSAAGTTADGGFAGLMSLLSASDPAGEASDAGTFGSDVLLPQANIPKDDDKNIPLALDSQGQIAMNFITLSALPTSGDASATTQPSVALSPSVVAQASEKTSSKAPIVQATDKRRPSDKADVTFSTQPGADASVKGHDAVSEVTTLLNNRSANASSGASQVQAEWREVRTHQLAQVPVVTPDVSRLAEAMASVNSAPNPSERAPSKLHSATSGMGMDGLSGMAQADKLGISPTYEVASTTAVVPDTQVAETVSYWATHGVQNAELTLDGLGKEPVEVRISVDGNQTQVDFLTNQPEVRQALESASAQLREMLSGEGLQLTGMSIGMSGRGQTPGDGGQAKQSPRQTTRVSLEQPAVTVTARVANSSVGRALDLYV